MFSFPSINSYPADDNPDGVSNSLPTAQTETPFVGGATRLLGSFLDRALEKDRTKDQIELIKAGASVAPTSPMAATVLGGQGGAAGIARLAIVGAVAVAAIGGAFWAVKRLAKG